MGEEGWIEEEGRKIGSRTRKKEGRTAERGGEQRTEGRTRKGVGQEG